MNSRDAKSSDFPGILLIFPPDFPSSELPCQSPKFSTFHSYFKLILKSLFSIFWKTGFGDTILLLATILVTVFAAAVMTKKIEKLLCRRTGRWYVHRDISAVNLFILLCRRNKCLFFDRDISAVYSSMSLENCKVLLLIPVAHYLKFQKDRMRNKPTTNQYLSTWNHGPACRLYGSLLVKPTVLFSQFPLI